MRSRSRQDARSGTSLACVNKASQQPFAKSCIGPCAGCDHLRTTIAYRDSNCLTAPSGGVLCKSSTVCDTVTCEARARCMLLLGSIHRFVRVSAVRRSCIEWPAIRHRTLPQASDWLPAAQSSLNMTLTAPVSRECTAQLNPAAICSPLKPKRCVIIGVTFTAPLSNRLMHSGYCGNSG